MTFCGGQTYNKIVIFSSSHTFVSLPCLLELRKLTLFNVHANLFILEKKTFRFCRYLLYVVDLNCGKILTVKNGRNNLTENIFCN